MNLTPQVPCGSWLACDSGVSGANFIVCQGLIAGKPAPTEKRALCHG